MSVPRIPIPRQQGPPQPQTQPQPRQALRMGVAGFSGSGLGIGVGASSTMPPADQQQSQTQGQRRRPQTASGGRRPMAATTDGRNAGAAGQNGNLEAEYIANLQQQIYFLELETNLLKERQSQESARNKGLGALDEMLPKELGDRLKALAVQYRKLEEQSHSLVESAEERAASAEEKARAAQREKEVMQQARDQLREQIERMRSESLIERERQQVEVINQADLIAQLKATIERQQDDVNRANEAKDATSHEMVELNRTLGSVQEKLDSEIAEHGRCSAELADTVKALDEERIAVARLNEEKEYYHGQEELRKALDERAEFELENRRLQIDLDAEIVAKEKMKEIANQRSEENVELINKLRQTEIALASRRADELWEGDLVGERRLGNAMEERDKLAKELDTAEVELSNSRRLVQELQTAVSSLEDELEEKSKNIESLKTSEADAQASVARMEEDQKQLRDAAAARGGECESLRASVSDLQSELEATCATLDETRNHVVALEERCRRLEQIARASKLMETLKIDDIESLVESSEQVTETMKGLSGLVRAFQGKNGE